jgi:NADH-quinone oxidoreductase subunit J
MFIEIIFSLLIVFLIYRILLTSSSVEAVFYLILLAINFSMILFFYGINFLAILYLAVYIGAVTVFFLFVVMMTDINVSWDIKSNQQYNLLGPINYIAGKLFYLLSATILSFGFANFVITLINFSEFKILFTNYNTSVVNVFLVDQFNSNIELLGFSILNEHSGPFIISSIIILIALIGSIFITTLVTEAENRISFSLTPSLANLPVFENAKSQEMETQSVRQFLNSIYLNINK